MFFPTTWGGMGTNTCKSKYYVSNSNFHSPRIARSGKKKSGEFSSNSFKNRGIIAKKTLSRRGKIVYFRFFEICKL